MKTREDLLNEARREVAEASVQDVHRSAQSEAPPVVLD